jgi:hypothetical protein
VGVVPREEKPSRVSEELSLRPGRVMALPTFLPMLPILMPPLSCRASVDDFFSSDASSPPAAADDDDDDPPEAAVATDDEEDDGDDD